MSDPCRGIRPRLGTYGDGELPPGEAREIAQHLAACADCRADLEATQRMTRLLREHWEDAAASPAPAGVTERLLAALDGEPDPPWLTGSPAGSRGTAAPAVVVRPPLRFLRRPTVRWASGVVAVAATVVIALRVSVPDAPRLRDEVGESRLEEAGTRAPTPSAVGVPPEVRGVDAAVRAPLSAPPGSAQSRSAHPDIRSSGSGPAPRSSAGNPTEARLAALALPPAREPAPGAAGGAPSSVGPMLEVRQTAATDTTVALSIPALEKTGARGAAESRLGEQVTPLGPQQGARAARERIAQRADTPASGLLDQFALAPPPPVTAADTLLGVVGAQAAVEREAEYLRGAGGALPARERSERWRVLGDVRAWLARTTRSRAEADRAIAALAEAMTLDPRSRIQDAERLQRLREFRDTLPPE